MVDRFVRIGAIVDGFGYDDTEFDSAIETTEPIKSGTPIDSNDVIRLGDLIAKVLSPLSVADISNPTELNSESGTAGALILAYEVVGAGLDEFTIYAYDASGPAVDSPYVVDASGAGSERWIAVAGKYSAFDTVNASREISSYAFTTGEAQATVTEAIMLANRYITDQGGAAETDILLVAVSYYISITIIETEGNGIEISPPAGESLDLDGTLLAADNCVDSPGTVGGKIVATRMQNAAGTWLWSLDTVRGAWVDSGVPD